VFHLIPSSETTADTLVPYAINLFQSKGYKVCISPYL
jgi:hypothetical protein